MVIWTKKKIYINDTFQITLGKFIVVMAITIFQFIGMLVDNHFILTGSMFFLFANALLTLSKQDEKITKNELSNIVNGIRILYEEGKSTEQIVDDIICSDELEDKTEPEC